MLLYGDDVDLAAELLEGIGFGPIIFLVVILVAGLLFATKIKLE